MAATDQAGQEQWRKVLIEGHRPLTVSRHLFRYVPSPPRCKMCNNPFGGAGGRVFRLAGFRPSRKNPNLCTKCCDSLPAGGAEVDIAVLFADIRGSTGIGERMRPDTFAELVNRFYGVATGVLLRHDALIDKLIGDEVMALFIPGVAGPDYRRRAVEAAADLLRVVGYGSDDGSWLDVGAAVNAGVAYVGNVGTQGVVDFTALGDPVNLASRMQALAAGGEVLIADDVHADVPAMFPGAPSRILQVRGRDAPVTAWAVSP